MVFLLLSGDDAIILQNLCQKRSKYVSRQIVSLNLCPTNSVNVLALYIVCGISYKHRSIGVSHTREQELAVQKLPQFFPPSIYWGVAGPDPLPLI